MTELFADYLVIDRALGQQIMRQHVPLTTAPVQIKKRVEDFPHVDLTRVPSAWTRFGRWDQRCHDGPLFVREIRGVLLSRLGFLQHKPTVSPLLTSITSRNVLFLQSLPNSIPYRQDNVRRRKDDTCVGTATRSIVERLSRVP